MNINNLKYFITVAELGSITLASNALYISQPALSKTIHNLEKEVGYELFSRTGKNIVLNSNGKIFYRYCVKIIQALEDAQKELKDLHSSKVTTVRVQLSAAAQFFVELLTKFQQYNPEIHFQFLDPSMISSQDLLPELVIFSSESTIMNECCETLYTEDFSLAVPSTHRLSSNSSVSIKDIALENFSIMLPEFSMRQTFDHYFKEHSVTPTIVYETGNFSLLKTMISNGLGISIVPSFSWKDIENQNLCKLVPIRDISFSRSVHIQWNDERYLSQACRKTLDYLFQYPYDIPRHSK